MKKIREQESRFFYIAAIASLLLQFLLCLHSFQANASATDETSAAAHFMPFKIGFEFQEMNRLCGWALNDNSVQKKPIFSVKDVDTGRTLWKVVIDSNDIEFVTEPFNFREKALVQRSIQSISLSFSVLVELLNTHEAGTVFAQWTDYISGRLASEGYALEHDELMGVVAGRPIQKPSSASWTPEFSPQVTIQHPLELTIPLYFCLFGFDNAAYTLPFSASLPGIDFLKRAMKEGNGEMFWQVMQGYTNNKFSGLMFLHAFTLATMSSDEDDKVQLTDTLKGLNTVQQVDVKAKLALMSRRPYSLMWQEIRNADIGACSDFFFKMMQKNASFIRWKITELFNRTNYAEQIFAPAGEILPLDSRIMPLLEDSFVAENHDVLIDLLGRGVISTTMVRNFKEGAKLSGLLGTDALEDYFTRSLTSVDVPEPTRLKINPTGEVESIGWDYDVLSPPLLLDPTNAMGFFKKGLKGHEKSYGEAIIEVRAIRDAAPRFLQKMKLDTKRQGHFLKDPPHLEKEALSLFDFLFNFGKKDLMDFSVGLPYTLMDKTLTY